MQDEKDLNLELVSSIGELLNKTLEIEFQIHEAKELPAKYMNDPFSEYQWIDDNTKWYETEKLKKKS